MISKMKALGIVLAAAFAVSAVAASAASAEETEAMTPGHFFSHAANGRTHIEGEQEGINNVFTITKDTSEVTEGTEEDVLATVECPSEEVSFTGTPSTTGFKEGHTVPVETVEGQTFTDVEVHPVYSPTPTKEGEEVKNCPVKLGGKAFGKAYVHTEGCNFVLSAHTDANEHAPVHIECEVGKEITITAALGCVIHVGSQTPDAGVHYKEEHGGTTASEEEAVTAEATVRKIKWRQEGCVGLPEEGESADYDSKITVKGYEDKSNVGGETKDHQVSIKWTKTTE